MQCDCEFIGCEIGNTRHQHQAAGCINKPEMKVEILGHTLNICFPCYITQTVCLAPNEYNIKEVLCG